MVPMSLPLRLVLTLPLACASVAPSLAQPTTGATKSAVVQEILDGKELYIDQQQARVNQQARPNWCPPAAAAASWLLIVARWGGSTASPS